MGILADFIVATEAEAKAYEGTATVSDSHRAQYNGFTEIELGTLYDVVQGRPTDDDSLYEFNVIRVVDDGERLTTEVLPDLASRLAAASDGDLDAWAEPWADTEEIDGAPEDVLPVLQDLRRLARLAQAEGKSLYLWNSV